MTASPKRVTGPSLTIKVFDGNVRILEKTFESFPISIGRQSEADVPLRAYKWMSRAHAEVHFMNGDFIFTVSAGAAPLKIDGKPVKSLTLNLGASIAIGPLRFEFVWNPADIQTELRLISSLPTDLASAETIVDVVPSAKLKQATPAKMREDRQNSPAKAASSEPTYVPGKSSAVKPVEPIGKPEPKVVDVRASVENRGNEKTVQQNQKNSKSNIKKIEQNRLSAALKGPSGRARPQDVEGETDVPAAKTTAINHAVESPRGVSASASPEASLAAAAARPQTANGHDFFSHHHEPRPFLDDGGLSALTILPRKDGKESSRTVFEGYVTWKDRIYDLKQFRAGDRLCVGPQLGAGLYAPLLERDRDFGVCTGSSTVMPIIPSLPGGIQSSNGNRSFAEFMRQAGLRGQDVPAGQGLKLAKGETITYELGHDVAVHFRHAPAPPALRLGAATAQDLTFIQTAVISGVFHLVIVILLLVFAPKNTAPKVDNVPDRYARLLVEPPRTFVEPKPTPTPPPTPKPVVPEPEPIKPKDPPKLEPKPPPKKPTKVIAKKMNKFPINIPSKRVAPEPVSVRSEPEKPVDVNTMGALAALNLGPAPKLPNDKPVSININPDAGGASSTNKGALSAIKAPGGKMSGVAGMSGPQTKGTGYGTGKGYGVQGVKGTACVRGVGGAVIGTPKLMKLERTEGLTQKQVMEEVKKHLGKIQQCYERALISNGSLAGRVEYEWVINPKGIVSSVKIKSSEMQGADGLNGCVTDVFRKMRFPAAKNGQETTPNVGFPFGRL